MKNLDQTNDSLGKIKDVSSSSFTGKTAEEHSIISKELGREVSSVEMTDFFDSKTYKEYKTQPKGRDFISQNDMVQFNGDGQLFINKIADDIYNKQRDKAVLPDLLEHRIDIKVVTDKASTPHAYAFDAGFKGEPSAITKIARGPETDPLTIERAKIESAGLFLRDLLQNGGFQDNKDTLPSLESEALLNLIQKGVISRDKIKRVEIGDKSFGANATDKKHEVLRVKTKQVEAGRSTDDRNRGERLFKEVSELSPEEQMALDTETANILKERLPAVTELRGFMEKNGVHTFAQDRIDRALAKFGYEFRKGEGYANIKDKNEDLDISLERANRYKQGGEFIKKQEDARKRAVMEEEAQAKIPKLQEDIANAMQSIAPETKVTSSVEKPKPITEEPEKKSLFRRIFG